MSVLKCLWIVLSYLAILAHRYWQFVSCERLNRQHMKYQYHPDTSIYSQPSKTKQNKLPQLTQNKTKTCKTSVHKACTVGRVLHQDTTPQSTNVLKQSSKFLNFYFVLHRLTDRATCILKKLLNWDLGYKHNYNCIFFPLCILYRWPEGGHLRSRHAAALKYINVHYFFLILIPCIFK
jgi:hypothetical protein